MTLASERKPRRRARPLDGLREELESVARIGSYRLDIASGSWVSSTGLDAILGIGPTFERSVGGWASLIHPDDRPVMLAYLADDVIGRGEPFDRRYRIVRPDTREERWVHGRGALQLGRSGRPLRMIGTIEDVTERVAAEAERARLEEGLRRSERNLAEAQRIAHIGSWEWDLATDTAQRSDELHRIYGVEPGTIPTTTEAFLEFVHPGDRTRVEASARAALTGGGPHALDYRTVRPDGSVRILHEEAHVIFDASGAPVRLIGTVQDVTELRRLEAQDRKLAQAVEQTSEAILITGSTAEIEYANPAFERLSGLRHEQLVGGKPGLLGTPQSQATFRTMWQTISAGGSWSGDLLHRRADGTEAVAEASVSPVRDAAGTVTAFVAVERDVTDERALQRERERLVAAVEQTSDSVVITDLAGTIEYVNPAFETVSGHRREKVIGQNPRILNSGRQSAAFYRALWRRLTHGQSWTGRFTNRRVDGELYEVEATISPIRDPSGQVAGYIGVERDVTALQAARSGLANEFRERAQVAAALARLQPGPSAEATAAEICHELFGLPGIDVTAIFNFLGPEHATTLAAIGPDGFPPVPGRPLPAPRAAYLYERAVLGPWAEAFRPRRVDGEYGRSMAAIGIRATAYAPIRNGEGLLGVIAAGTTDEAYARHLIEHMPAVGEFAATASALLARDLEGDHRVSRHQAQIAEIVTSRAFHPVFQPIVDMEGDAVVGYEALTRFADGTRPDRRFAEAWSFRVGADLELATLDAAVTAARRLPAGRWLNVNVSPRLLEDHERVRAVLAQADRPLIVEITEHDTVADYHALRDAIGRLGDSVRIAVDDAGAGIANFAHIIELRPDFVKLDIGLVRGVNVDLGRQALVVAMRHFARTAGCRLIGEGVETEAEALSLMTFGVDFGQGFFFGHPATVDALTAEAADTQDRAES